MRNLPFISIVIPCLNEELFIGSLLKGLVQQIYPQNKMEILVVDGMSDDKTRAIVIDMQLRHSNIRLLDNRDKFTPHAMNLGLDIAKGKYIFTLGAHANYPLDYISGLVGFALEKKVALVGGAVKVKPRSADLIAYSISIALNHPFGVGNGSYRTGDNEEKKVDTVAYGCYEKDFLNKVGYFDLNLKRNQDIELNKRILHNGGEIWYTPSVSCTYFSKSTFEELWRLYYANGKWVIWTLKLTQNMSSLSLRHFVPLGFFLYWLLLPIVVFVFPILAVIAFVYSVISIIISFKVSISKRQLSLFLPLVLSFWILHFSYGFGSFVGILTKPK